MYKMHALPSFCYCHFSSVYYLCLKVEFPLQCQWRIQAWGKGNPRLCQKWHKSTSEEGMWTKHAFQIWNILVIHYLICIVELFRKVISTFFWMTNAHAIFPLVYLVIFVKIDSLLTFLLIVKTDKISPISSVSNFDGEMSNMMYDLWLLVALLGAMRGVSLSKGEKHSPGSLWT